MQDEEAMRAAIVADPDDDTVRLAYADFLDERSEGSDTDRAKFIRAQIALAKAGPPHARLGFESISGACDLFSAGPRYWTTEDFEAGIPVGTRVDVKYTRLISYVKNGGNTHGVKRGLVVVKMQDNGSDGVAYTLKRDEYSGKWAGTGLAELCEELHAKHHEAWERCPCPRCESVLTLAASGSKVAKTYLTENRCMTCRGSGDLLRPSYASGEYMRRVTFSRGFIDSVACEYHEVIRDGFTVKPSRWATSVVKSIPVVRFAIHMQDVYPLPTQLSFLIQAYLDGLPAGMHKFLRGNYLEERGVLRSCSWNTKEEFSDDLNTAAAKWVREQSGLKV